MIATIWRFLVAVFDWRTIWRQLNGCPVADAVFITNMRDEIDRRRYLGGRHPKEGHFNGPRYWLGNISGRTRALDITAEEMLGCKGRKKAREQFVAATRWAEQNGAKVVLLAAATKRLFKREELSELKAEFPGIIFTIGDNGTVLLLMRETMRALEGAGLKSGYSRIAILGSYGFLGEVMTRTLKDLDYEVIGAGPNTRGLKQVAEEYGIATCQTIAEIGGADAVVACTYSEAVRLTAENIELIRRNGKKLLVIDVAEPSNLRYKEYQKCKNIVVRQDAGNAYAPRLKYILGAISYRMFRLTQGMTFGCFAEAISLASALKQGENIGNIDWLTINDEKMEIVAKMFKRDGFTIPPPRCFSRPVKSFDLALSKVKNQSTCIPAWKLIAQRMHIL